MEFVKSTFTLVFLFAIGSALFAQKSDCTKTTVINNGVCIDGNRNICSKRDAQLRACFAPDPQYTEAAPSAQIKGTLQLTAVVGTSGCVQDIKVLTPLGYGLDDSSIVALKSWRFQKLKKETANQYRIQF